jgi:hypothetical protein
MKIKQAKTKADRKALVAALEISSLGLTTREVLEQSDCFVFQDGQLLTFNGEILTRCKNPLPQLSGAVPAAELMALLKRFPDDEIEITQDEHEVKIKAGRRRAGIPIAQEVQLPFAEFPEPKDWNPLPEKVTARLLEATRSCGKDVTQPQTTLVCVEPKFIEATDNLRIYRAVLKTGISARRLIPASALERVAKFPLSQFSEDKEHIHFKIGKSHSITLRCHSLQGYRPLKKFVDSVSNGEKVDLPKTLPAIIERADIMQDGSFDASVTVHLHQDTLTIESKKDRGWFRESANVSYSGPELQFSVHPKMLVDILERSQTVEIAGPRLRVDGQNVVQIVALKVN